MGPQEISDRERISEKALIEHAFKTETLKLRTLPAHCAVTAALFQQAEFWKFFKFGIVDNGLLVLMTCAGVGLDDLIAKFLRTPKGWGALIGAW